jgi:hypothetical protein
MARAAQVSVPEEPGLLVERFNPVDSHSRMAERRNPAVAVQGLAVAAAPFGTVVMLLPTATRLPTRD